VEYDHVFFFFYLTLILHQELFNILLFKFEQMVAILNSAHSYCSCFGMTIQRTVCSIRQFRFRNSKREKKKAITLKEKHTLTFTIFPL